MNSENTPSPESHVRVTDVRKWQVKNGGLTIMDGDLIVAHVRGDDASRDGPRIGALPDLLMAASAVVDAYDRRAGMPDAITALEAILRPLGFCSPANTGGDHA